MGLPRVQYNHTPPQDTLITELASPASQWGRITTSRSATTFLSNLFSKIYPRMQFHPHSMNSGWLAQLLKYLHIRVHSPSLANASNSLVSSHIAHNLSLPRSSQSLDTSVSGDFVSGKVATPELKLRSRKEFIDELIADKAKFDAYLYTDWETVSEQLNERRKSAQLTAYVQSQLPGGLPEIMKDKKSMVFGRAVATPSYEMQRFMSYSDLLSHLQPIIFEYTADKFCDANSYKRSLVKLQVCNGFDKKNQPMISSRSIVSQSNLNGKPLNSILNIEGESIVDYHHKIFFNTYPHMKNHIFDVSDWSAAKGKSARDWYKMYLVLFLKDAVLFENYVTMKYEINITKNIVLPLVAEIESECGYKPLIVPLQKESLEGHKFWESYPAHIEL